MQDGDVVEFRFNVAMALRDGFDARSRELADLLQEWDVLGVYEDLTSDPRMRGEYDDLVEPLRAWLTEGLTAHELSACVWSIASSVTTGSTRWSPTRARVRTARAPMVVRCGRLNASIEMEVQMMSSSSPTTEHGLIA